MFEPKKRRTPLPCSSRRRPVARAASPRTAFACKERTSGGVIAGRRGGAGERHESGRKAARNGAAFYAPFGKSSAPRRARHVVYGGMRAPDIGDSGGNPIGAARPHGTCANCAAGRGIAFARRQAAYAAGEKRKGARGLRLPAGSSAASVAPHARRGAAKRRTVDVGARRKETTETETPRLRPRRNVQSARHRRPRDERVERARHVRIAIEFDELARLVEADQVAHHGNVAMSAIV